MTKIRVEPLVDLIISTVSISNDCLPIWLQDEKEVVLTSCMND